MIILYNSNELRIGSCKTNNLYIAIQTVKKENPKQDAKYFSQIIDIDGRKTLTPLMKIPA